MSQELFYTSAPQGLKPGTHGFCSVAITRGMAAPLVERLESLSGYRPAFPPHDPRAAHNPVVYAHWRLSGGSKAAAVLSRVCAAGLDYSQRHNKFAHHVVLEPEELPDVGPAWLLQQPGFMETEWDGEVRMLPAGRRPPRGDTAPAPCHAWHKATGDAGWAGVLLEAFAADPNRAAYLIFEPHQDPLPLLAEAIALLPARRRWEVTFNTYYTSLPPGVRCAWRCVLKDSPEAAEAERLPGALFLDLTANLDRAPNSEWVERARTGQPAVERYREPVAPAYADEVAEGYSVEPVLPDLAPVLVGEERLRPTSRGPSVRPPSPSGGGQPPAPSRRAVPPPPPPVPSRSASDEGKASRYLMVGLGSGFFGGVVLACLVLGGIWLLRSGEKPSPPMASDDAKQQEINRLSNLLQDARQAADQARQEAKLAQQELADARAAGRTPIPDANARPPGPMPPQVPGLPRKPTESPRPEDLGPRASRLKKQIQLGSELFKARLKLLALVSHLPGAAPPLPVNPQRLQQINHKLDNLKQQLEQEENLDALGDELRGVLKELDNINRPDDTPMPTPNRPPDKEKKTPEPNDLRLARGKIANIENELKEWDPAWDKERKNRSADKIRRLAKDAEDYLADVKRVFKPFTPEADELLKKLEGFRKRLEKLEAGDNE
jgi:hypothetical protein